MATGKAIWGAGSASEPTSRPECSDCTRFSASSDSGRRVPGDHIYFRCPRTQDVNLSLSPSLPSYLPAGISSFSQRGPREPPGTPRRASASRTLRATCRLPITHQAGLTRPPLVLRTDGVGRRPHRAWRSRRQTCPEVFGLVFVYLFFISHGYFTRLNGTFVNTMPRCLRAVGVEARSPAGRRGPRFERPVLCPALASFQRLVPPPLSVPHSFLIHAHCRHRTHEGIPGVSPPN